MSLRQRVLEQHGWLSPSAARDSGVSPSHRCAMCAHMSGFDRPRCTLTGYTTNRMASCNHYEAHPNFEERLRALGRIN